VARNDGAHTKNKTARQSRAPVWSVLCLSVRLSETTRSRDRNGEKVRAGNDSVALLLKSLDQYSGSCRGVYIEMVRGPYPPPRSTATTRRMQTAAPRGQASARRVAASTRRASQARQVAARSRRRSAKGVADRTIPATQDCWKRSSVTRNIFISYCLRERGGNNRIDGSPAHQLCYATEQYVTRIGYLKERVRT
jgi:hypothetical protein